MTYSPEIPLTLEERDIEIIYLGGMKKHHIGRYVAEKENAG